MSETKSENIGDWERQIGLEYELHMSWLRPAVVGEICSCCKKLRDFSHYIQDTSFCVFCSVTCEDGEACRSLVASDTHSGFYIFPDENKFNSFCGHAVVVQHLEDLKATKFKRLKTVLFAKLSKAESEQLKDIAELFQGRYEPEIRALPA